MRSYNNPLDLAQRPTVLDLFSGAGGTGLGFLQAGFQIVGAVEKNPYAAETYSRNIGIAVDPIDITEDITPQSFREQLGLATGELDVLVGCPPCQGFSRMRNRNGASDSRNELVRLYLKFVKEFMPRFALFENVPGLIKLDHGKEFFNELCNGLTETLGYRLIQSEVDAADYGVPQRRKRVIVIAAQCGLEPAFPEPTHARYGTLEVASGLRLPWVTVRAAIGNSRYPMLKSGENGECDGRYPNHIAPLTGEDVLNFIRRVPHDGGSRTDVPSEHWLRCHHNHKGHKDVYGRLRWDDVANTITSGCTNPSRGRFVHPEQNRALTPREAAKLQGFPDDFIFYGGLIAQQIGNAVPPPLARAIAESLKKQLDINVSAEVVTSDPNRS